MAAGRWFGEGYRGARCAALREALAALCRLGKARLSGVSEGSMNDTFTLNLHVRTVLKEGTKCRLRRYINCRSAERGDLRVPPTTTVIRRRSCRVAAPTVWIAASAAARQNSQRQQSELN